jgi:hypothetical protein
MKTIIQVWTHHCYNKPQTETENYWGLGDILRGTLQLYMLSKKMKFTLYVDTSLHPISKYLVPTENPHAELIQLSKDMIMMISDDAPLEEIIGNLSDTVYYFFTNAQCTEPYDDDCKAFMKSIMTPIPSLESELNTRIPFKTYSILHFRLGDKELVNNKGGDISQNILRLIEENKEANSVLISDSVSLKTYPHISEKVHVLNTIPRHLGRCDDIESIKDTLIDFFILSRATHIKTYSCYNWISGFVFWAHQIYDIPLSKIK